MSCGMYVQFIKCEILILGKFVSNQERPRGLSDLRADDYYVDNPYGQLVTG
jgi:hypothetical protein